jgi:hypothetical protein
MTKLNARRTYPETIETAVRRRCKPDSGTGSYRTIVRSFLMATSLFVASVAAQEFEISRSTIDGGGVMRSAGGDFELSGTIGQPDAGVMASNDGALALSGGFWFSLAAGDCNDDGIVSLFDLAELNDCTMGPGVGVGEQPCPCLDLDHDNDVDILDFGIFQAAFEGS